MERNFKNTYFGYTDKFSPMQKVKVEKSLDKSIRYKGTIYTYKEYARVKLLEGYRTEVVENYSYYSSRTNDYTKPKTDYRLVNIESNQYHQGNKTIIDYADYLLTNNFINDKIALDYFQAESIAAEKAEQEQARLKAEEKRIKQEKEQSKKDFNNWLWDKVEEYKVTDSRVELIEQIALAELGSFSHHMIRLLVLIDNIDNAECKETLIDWLHSQNKTSKKIFFHVTGIKLPNTNKGTLEILSNLSVKDFQGEISSYTKRKEVTKVQYNQDFYIRYKNEVVKVLGKSIKIKGIDRDLFERKDDSNCSYSVTDLKTGILLFNGSTKTLLQENIDKLKEKAIAFFNDNANIKRIEQLEKEMIEMKDKILAAQQLK